MAAFAVELSPRPGAVAPAAVGCARQGCIERGTACGRCLRNGAPTDDAPAFTDGQASFILRTKLAHSCVEGESFESAWTFATAAVVAVSPPGQARAWRRAVEAVRDEYAEAYRRKRVRLATRNAVSHESVLETASGPAGHL